MDVVEEPEEVNVSPIHQIDGTNLDAHYKKLIVAGKIPDSIITVVTGDNFIEFSTGYELHDLRENCFAGIHVVRYLKGNEKVTNSNRVQEIQSIYC
jgi:hypothetical protein